MPIRRDPASEALIGQPVTVTGSIGPGGALLPDSITPDLLVIDPGAYFGPQVGVVLIEGFAVIDRRRLRFGPGFSAPAPGLRFEGVERGVFRFDRAATGLRATGFADHFAAPSRSEPSPRFEPAPMPNRSIRSPVGGGIEGPRGSDPRNRQGRDRNGNANGNDALSRPGAPSFGPPLGDPRGR